jgi:hypothetical protein
MRLELDLEWYQDMSDPDSNKGSGPATLPKIIAFLFIHNLIELFNTIFSLASYWFDLF